MWKTKQEPERKREDSFIYFAAPFFGSLNGNLGKLLWKHATYKGVPTEFNEFDYDLEGWI